MILIKLDTILSNQLEFKTTAICLILALAFGVALAFVYKYFKKNQGYSIDLPLAIILLPIGASAIVMVARILGLQESDTRTTMAFSFAGILALARFRSTQHDITDITFLSSSMILGFLCGLGYVIYAAIVLILICLVVFIVSLTKFNAPSSKEMTLKIVVPESLNFDNLFDDVLQDGCKSYNLKSVKTTEFGTMFELTYVVTLKNETNQHEFIDKIRERNGNLNISLNVRRFNSTFQQ